MRNMQNLADQSLAVRWYCIQAKPRNEKRALFHVTRAGIETLHPLIETYTSRSATSKKVLEPLFPGYFFARFSIGDHYPTVRWARGVKQILGNQKGPIPVGEEVIGEIQKRIDSHGVARRPYDLKPKDPVKVKAGPLRDLIGVFDCWVPKEGRVRILLRLLGHETSVEIEYNQVEKVWHSNRSTTLPASAECL
jgi:transcriptional antiterminator RfaH